MKTPPTHRAALLLTGLASLFLVSALQAQGVGRFGAGFEFQVYPSGGIFTARGSIRLDGNDALFGYLGYNVAERGNNGKHLQEEGGGPGAGLSWRHYLGEDHSGLHF